MFVLRNSSWKSCSFDPLSNTDHSAKENCIPINWSKEDQWCFEPCYGILHDAAVSANCAQVSNGCAQARLAIKVCVHFDCFAHHTGEISVVCILAAFASVQGGWKLYSTALPRCSQRSMNTRLAQCQRMWLVRVKLGTCSTGFITTEP